MIKRPPVTRKAPRRFYYWILTFDGGKPFLIFGSDKNEDEARSKGLDQLGSLDFQIRRLPTRHLPTASAMVRGKRLESGHGLRASTQRIGHQKSIDRLHRRAERRRH